MSKYHLLFARDTPGSEKIDGSFVYPLDDVKIMGVLNVTPDSFSDGDQYFQVDAAVAHAKELIADGADVIDVGGESTRPGATPVSVKDELERVLPVIERLAMETRAIISIDSYKPEVVKESLQAGAHIANDISGGRDEKIFDICAEIGAPLVIMHMQGEPLTMQKNPKYENAPQEVASFLLSQAHRARQQGVSSLMLDPGIGFGKRLEDNITLLNDIADELGSEYPLLIGASRKKMIQMIEGRESHARDRDWGSIATHLYSIMRGASMIRVHNVRAHSQAMKVWNALTSDQKQSDE